MCERETEGAWREPVRRDLLKSESYSLTTYWSDSTLSSRRFGEQASRHGSLNSPFQAALLEPVRRDLLQRGESVREKETEYRDYSKLRTHTALGSYGSSMPRSIGPS